MEVCVFYSSHKIPVTIDLTATILHVREVNLQSHDMNISKKCVSIPLPILVKIAYEIPIVQEI